VQLNPPLHWIGPERSLSFERSLKARPVNGLTLCIGGGKKHHALHRTDWLRHPAGLR